MRNAQNKPLHGVDPAAATRAFELHLHKEGEIMGSHLTKLPKYGQVKLVGHQTS